MSESAISQLRGVVVRTSVWSGGGVGSGTERIGATVNRNPQNRERIAMKTTELEQAEVKNFTSPDEVREFPLGRAELIEVGGATVGRATLQPGWRWSESIKPIAQTPSCQAAHFQYHVAGTLRIRMDDGTELDCKPGDVSAVAPGHDAWVVGDEPVVIVDFQGMIDFAKAH
jgi:hypothetical protein